MAVCGRCMICGHKFSCERTDEAIRWICTAPKCDHQRKFSQEAWGEEFTHAICVTCHDALVDDEAISETAKALLALVRERALAKIKQ